MKKIFSLALILAAILTLSACVEVRNTPPQLNGVQGTVTINFGDEFDPLAGITAKDDQDGNLTSEIELVGWNPAWLTNSAGGQYSYSIYVEDSAGLSATQIVQLTIIGSVSQTVSLLYVQEAQSYYIGSKPYNPLRGVVAIDTVSGEPVDITDQIEVVGLPNLTRPGRFNFQLTVQNELGASATRTVALTVKPAVSNIPTTLTTSPVTITLWHSNGSTIEGALKLYANQFMAANPNITVVIQKNGDNYDMLRQNVVSAIKGGTLPNIVQGYPDHVAEYITNNAVISVGPYIDHATWGFDANNNSEKFEDILWKYRNENSQYTADGEFYSLPFNKSTEVMIYNSDVVNALIASGDITEFPKTWQDLFAVADKFEAVAPSYIDQYAAKLKLTSAEITNAKAIFVPYSYDSEANAFITLLRQWGGSYTGINSERKGVALYDSTQARAMMNYFSANKDKLTIPSNWGTQYASDIFKKGQTFMTIGSTGGAYYNTPTMVDGEYLFNFEVVPLPYNKDLPQHATAIQQGTNMSLANTGTDQQKLASWLFLKFLNSNEVQLDFTLKTGYQPTRSSVYTTPQYQNLMNGIAQDGVTPLQGEDLMRAKAAKAAAAQSEILFFDQAFVGSSAIRAAVGVTFQRIMIPTASDTVENALQYAIAEARRILGN
ncbi:MAG: extracellular solute-binding protein [Acholeplasmataceae bacterium]|nr:extracellular solute-binding protein [Acholeplasmataceae bacterium]